MVERLYGSITRVVDLPVDVDPDVSFVSAKDGSPHAEPSASSTRQQPVAATE